MFNARVYLCNNFVFSVIVQGQKGEVGVAGLKVRVKENRKKRVQVNLPCRVVKATVKASRQKTSGAIE